MSSDPKIIGIKTYPFENFSHKKGSRKLFTVRHVFVEFVEGMESGIRNAEFATLFLLLFVEKIISHLQYFFASLFLKL